MAKMKMDQEQVKAVLSGYTTLILSELSKDDNNRFMRVVKLCTLASALVDMNNVTVDAADEESEFQNTVIGGGALGVRYGNANQHPVSDVVREIVAAVSPLVQNMQGTPEQQLDKLLTLREGLEHARRDTSVIDARIDAKLAEMATTQKVLPASSAVPEANAPETMMKSQPVVAYVSPDPTIAVSEVGGDGEEIVPDLHRAEGWAATAALAVAPPEAV